MLVFAATAPSPVGSDVLYEVKVKCACNRQCIRCIDPVLHDGEDGGVV